MRLVSDYMRDPELRQALGRLARAVFGFDFEGWVTGGYYEGDYIPWSLEEDGRILANVSASRMVFAVDGETRRYIQLGTVMTDAEYRGQGLGRKLMERVIREYRDRCDGIYLFANLKTLGFYDRFGFRRVREWRYTATLPARRGQPFSPASAAEGPLYRQAVREACMGARMEQVNRWALTMFYTANMEGVHRCPELDAWAVWEEEEGGRLTLKSVISRERPPLSEVLARLPAGYDRADLGFAPFPEDAGLCRRESYDGGEDYRLYCMGGDLGRIERDGLLFPALSHT